MKHIKSNYTFIIFALIICASFLSTLFFNKKTETLEITRSNIAFSHNEKLGFINVKNILNDLVKYGHGPSINNFCVIAYESKEKQSPNYAWVYWKEKDAMILWEPVEIGEKVDLTYSRRYLDLTKDVVNNEEELHGSTYKVTRNWVDNTLSECKKYGQEYIINNQ